MRVALVNPNWTFDGSIYFGCRAPHLPLEYGYSRRMLEDAGHEVHVTDGHLFGLSLPEIEDEIRSFAAEMVVVTTAPSYLFWRCAPPELRVPQEVCGALREHSPLLVVVGPHGSTTPRAALRKLGADIAVMGECEELLLRIASGERDGVSGLCYREGREIRVTGGPVATRFIDLPSLEWENEVIAKHDHHHHRFEAPPLGPGAEVEASRGCPYSCTFC
ncbi:MAG: cobalamin-dependent protein, partial [Hyphomicrobiales bacterium]